MTPACPEGIRNGPAANSHQRQHFSDENRGIENPGRENTIILMMKAEPVAVYMRRHVLSWHTEAAPPPR